MKCLNRSRAWEEKAEAELKGLKKSALSSRATSSISPSQTSDSTGPHNKENCREKPCPVDLLPDDEALLSSSGLAEDSGYLSLHNSQVEPHEASTHCEEVSERCVEEAECRLSPVESETRANCLPVLKFQEAVCKQLARDYRKSQNYDWTVVNKLAKRYSLHNVIGAKMGLEYVDILCGLFKKNMKHILAMILSLLGESDLINCKKVSKTWRKIIHEDKIAAERCGKAEQILTLQDTERSRGSLSRDFGLNRVVFSCLQTVASSTPVHKSTRKIHSQTDGAHHTTNTSRFAAYLEAAKSLKGNETLRGCHLCGSPAQVDPGMERAVCTRASCAFEFCILCKSSYHGSSPCQRGIIKSSHCKTVPLSGSTRSKRSIRRL